MTSSLFRGTEQTERYTYNFLNFFDTVGIEDWGTWDKESVIREVQVPGPAAAPIPECGRWRRPTDMHSPTRVVSENARGAWVVTHY